MPVYRYELRQGDDVIATGHITRDAPAEVGERLTIAGHDGIVRTVEPLLGDSEQRLVVQALNS